MLDRIGNPAYGNTATCLAIKGNTMRIAVASGKGGTGKTNVATNLATISDCMGGAFGVLEYATTARFLFLAVWVPCCTSDIVFPLLFTKK